MVLPKAKSVARQGTAIIGSNPLATDRPQLHARRWSLPIESLPPMLNERHWGCLAGGASISGRKLLAREGPQPVREDFPAV